MMWNIHGPIQTQPINITTSGDNIIIPAITDGEIFVLDMSLGAGGVVDVTTKCGSRSQSFDKMVAGESINFSSPSDREGEPKFKCFQGEDFIVNLSTGVAMSGHITYAFKK